MTFTESNTVEQMILDSVAPKRHGEPLNIREDLAPGWRGSLRKRARAKIPIKRSFRRAFLARKWPV